MFEISLMESCLFFEDSGTINTLVMVNSMKK